jgi:RND family efflux transporter MFP subunit
MPDAPRDADRAELLRQLRIDRTRGAARRRRGRWLPLAAAVLLALAALAWLAVARARPPVVETAVAVPAAQVPGAASVLDASGYVTARRQATVSAKITGKVVEVRIEEGMRVEEGAVLARLDDTEARAQLELARAQLAASRSQLAEIRAQLEQAERDFVRQSRLAEQQLIAAQALDAARAHRDTLRARLASAGEQVTVARESVDVAEVQLANTVIRAPFAGVVVAKAAQPGEMISPISAGGGFTRTGIGTIVDMDSLEIQVDVNEAYINRVTPGQPVEAMLNAYPEWRIPAEVIAIIPTADRSKATVKVRIAIKAKDPRIVPDMGVRVSFLGAQPGASPAVPSGVVVPAAAVQADGEAGVVFVYAGDRVERRSVTLGQDLGGQRHVLAGLREGERVVLSPPPSLADGDRVRLARTE